MPSGTFQVYGQGLFHALTGATDLDGDDWYAALASSSYSPNVDTHDFWDDVVANEVTGTGWAANGQQLSGETVTVVGASNEVRFTATDLSVPTVTLSDGKHLIVYSRTNGTNATRELLGYVVFDTALAPQGGTLDIDFDGTNGLFKLTY